MALKLEKILESMDSFKLHSDVVLLENTELTDLVRAQTRKELHENFNFIKGQLIQGGLLEEAQNMLSEAWTQAIMEDISMPEFLNQDDEGISAGEAAAAAAGLGAAGYGARVAIPAGQAMMNARNNSGANLTDTMTAGKQAAMGTINGDINASKAAVANGVDAVKNNPYVANPGLALANAKADTEQAIRMAANDISRKATAMKDNQVGAAYAGYMGVQGPTKPGTGAAYAAGSALGKVKRAFSK